MLVHESIQEQFLDDYIPHFKNTIRNLEVDTEYDRPTEEQLTSDEALESLLDSDVVADTSYKRRRIAIDMIPELSIPSFRAKLYRFLSERFPNSSIIQSGFFYYPPNEGMAWHTNSDTPYTRCYLSWSENGNSYFKYRNSFDGKTVISQDLPGWNIRHFDINSERKELFWHSVYSKEDRISVGFRIINNLK